MSDLQGNSRSTCTTTWQSSIPHHTTFHTYLYLFWHTVFFVLLETVVIHWYCRHDCPSIENLDSKTDLLTGLLILPGKYDQRKSQLHHFTIGFQKPMQIPGFWNPMVKWCNWDFLWSKIEPHTGLGLCPPAYTFYSLSYTSTYRFWLTQVGWLFSGWTVSIWRHGNWTRGARFLTRENPNCTILPLDSRNQESAQIPGFWNPMVKWCNWDFLWSKYPVTLVGTCCGYKSLKVILIDTVIDPVFREGFFTVQFHITSQVTGSGKHKRETVVCNMENTKDDSPKKARFFVVRKEIYNRYKEKKQTEQ